MCQVTIYAALEADIGNGHVWLEQNDLPARCVVKITNKANGRKVYCEALQFDKNFLKRYSAPGGKRLNIDDPGLAIVMGYWYRAWLGDQRPDGDLKTSSTCNLLVQKAVPCWGDMWACLHHPQLIVRMTMRLALLSVGLGLVGAVPMLWWFA